MNRPIQMDDAEVIEAYSKSRSAVRELAAKYGCQIDAVYNKLRKLGIPIRRGGDASIGTQRGVKNPNWGGGRRLVRGYVVIWVDGEYQFEHRIVAEKSIGRSLLDGEEVHHVNGIKSDNRPENLVVCSSHAEHMKHHIDRDHCRRAGLVGGRITGSRMKAAALAKTHCSNGHALTEENTRTTRQGWRRCRTCESAYGKMHRSMHWNKNAALGVCP